jgi:hypothetical protein
LPILGDPAHVLILIAKCKRLHYFARRSATDAAGDRVCIDASILDMNVAGNQFGSSLAPGSYKTLGGGVSSLGIRDQLQSWRNLPFCKLELMTVKVVPKLTTDQWRQIIETEEGICYPGGTFSGPRLNGVIVHTAVTGSYDAQERRIHILAKDQMQTDDGAIIYKTDRSCWLGADDAIERLIRGDEVADSKYYLVGFIEYAVSDPSYAWLTEGQYLTRGLVEGDFLHVAQFRAIPVP